MCIINKLAITAGVTAIVSAASVIGVLTGVKIWRNGLGDKVGETTKKVFKQE